MRPLGNLKVPAAALAAILTMLLALVWSPPALASSHREAPAVTEDPLADDTDFYMFRDPRDPTRVVLIGNWIPFEEPAGGPNFHHFGENIRYQFHIDSDGDGIEDITFRFLFTRHVRTGTTFLNITGGFSSIASTNLNVYYTYSIDRIIGPADSAPPSAITRIADGLLEAPPNVGPKSYPSGYEVVSHGGVYGVDGDILVFAGPRADPFFVDLGMIFDLINLEGRGAGPFKGIGGNNDVAGFNIHSIALSIPITQLTKNGTLPTSTSDPNAIISAWVATYRQASRTLGSNGGPAVNTGAFVQVSRLGNPLINEVIIPLALKDQFNATEPANDAQYGAYVLDPEVPKLLKALFNIDSPPAPRTDLLLLVQGLDGLTKRPGEVIADQLRLNVAVPTTPFATANRLGVIAGDNAGFPNGRRPLDDVVDIELRVLAGVLVSGFNVSPNNALGDNVNQPDQEFLCCFPFLATPNAGFDHKHDNPNDPRLCPPPSAPGPVSPVKTADTQ